MTSRNKLRTRTTREGFRSTCNAFSNSKKLCSFGVGERMPSIKKPINDSIGSDLRSSITKRSAGFGIGSRFQSPSPLDQRQKSPEPGSYDLPSEFRIQTADAPKRNCFSFGIGHKAYEKVYIPGMAKLNSDSPDPGKYTSNYMNISHN